MNITEGYQPLFRRIRAGDNVRIQRARTEMGIDLDNCDSVRAPTVEMEGKVFKVAHIDVSCNGHKNGICTFSPKKCACPTKGYRPRVKDEEYESHKYISLCLAVLSDAKTNREYVL